MEVLGHDIGYFAYSFAGGFLAFGSLAGFFIPEILSALSKFMAVCAVISLGYMSYLWYRVEKNGVAVSKSGRYKATMEKV